MSAPAETIGNLLSHSSFEVAANTRKELSQNASVCMSLMKVRFKKKLFEDGLKRVADLY